MTALIKKLSVSLGLIGVQLWQEDGFRPSFSLFAALPSQAFGCCAKPINPHLAPLFHDPLHHDIVFHLQSLFPEFSLQPP